MVSLAIYRRNVLLYFTRRASLADPDGLLRGGGTRGRHLRFDAPDLLADPRVEARMKSAIGGAPRPFDPPSRVA